MPVFEWLKTKQKCIAGYATKYRVAQLNEDTFLFSLCWLLRATKQLNFFLLKVTFSHIYAEKSKNTKHVREKFDFFPNQLSPSRPILPSKTQPGLPPLQSSISRRHFETCFWAFLSKKTIFWSIKLTNFGQKTSPNYPWVPWR